MWQYCQKCILLNYIQNIIPTYNDWDLAHFILNSSYMFYICIMSQFISYHISSAQMYNDRWLWYCPQHIYNFIHGFLMFLGVLRSHLEVLRFYSLIYTPGSRLTVLRGPNRMLGIKLRLTTSKASTLLSVLSLLPPVFDYWLWKRDHRLVWKLNVSRQHNAHMSKILSKNSLKALQKHFIIFPS